MAAEQNFFHRWWVLLTIGSDTNAIWEISDKCEQIRNGEGFMVLVWCDVKPTPKPEPEPRPKGRCPVPGPKVVISEDEYPVKHIQEMHEWLDKYIGEGPCIDNPNDNISKSELILVASEVSELLRSLILKSFDQPLDNVEVRKLLAGFSDLMRLSVIASSGLLEVDRDHLAISIGRSTSEIKNIGEETFYIPKLLKAYNQCLLEIYHSTRLPKSRKDRMEVFDHHVGISHDLIDAIWTTYINYVENRDIPHRDRKTAQSSQ